MRDGTWRKRMYYSIAWPFLIISINTKKKNRGKVNRGAIWCRGPYFQPAIESTPDAIQETGVQQYGFDPKHFTTLCYYKHGEKGSWLDSKFGKVIVDVSRIGKEEKGRVCNEWNDDW